MTQPGDIVDGYRIETKLGEGGFGTVYRAVHGPSARVVALKVLHRRFLDTPVVLERFLAEARAGALRGSPHIVEVLDSGRGAEGDAFLAMELLEGEPLDERLGRDAPVRGDVALDIAVQILRGLGDAHRAGVVHRDLKPANVFLVGPVGTDAPRVKLLDFGVSRFTQEAGSPSLTKTGMILGTPLYMAPEQFLAVKTVDGRADLYSASVLFYQMLSGHMPFAAETYEELVIRINTTAPTPLGDVAPWLPGGLRHVVERGLHRDPDGRFSTAAEYIAALEALATANTVEALRAGSATLGERPLAAPTPHPAPGPPHAHARTELAPVSVPPQPTPATRMTPPHDVPEAAPLASASPWASAPPPGPAASPAALGAAPPRAPMAPPSRGPNLALVAALGLGGALVAGLAVIGVLSIASSGGAPATSIEATPPVAITSTPPPATPAPTPHTDTDTAPHTDTDTHTAPHTDTDTDTAPDTHTDTDTDTAPDTHTPPHTAPAPPHPAPGPGGGTARVRYSGLSPTFRDDDGREIARQVARRAGHCATGPTTRLTIEGLYSNTGRLIQATPYPFHTSDAPSECVAEVVRDVASEVSVEGSGIFRLQVTLDP